MFVSTPWCLRLRKGCDFRLPGGTSSRRFHTLTSSSLAEVRWGWPQLGLFMRPPHVPAGPWGGSTEPILPEEPGGSCRAFSDPVWEVSWCHFCHLLLVQVLCGPLQVQGEKSCSPADVEQQYAHGIITRAMEEITAALFENPIALSLVDMTSISEVPGWWHLACFLGLVSHRSAWLQPLDPYG